MASIDHYHKPDAPMPNSIVTAVTAFVQDKAGRVIVNRRIDNVWSFSLVV